MPEVVPVTLSSATGLPPTVNLVEAPAVAATTVLHLRVEVLGSSTMVHALLIVAPGKDSISTAFAPLTTNLSVPVSDTAPLWAQATELLSVIT